jgi:hypothetical protein
MWQPIEGTETIPCACGHSCGDRYAKVSSDSYPGTQEVIVHAPRAHECDRGQHVITYLPAGVRVCREVPDREPRAIFDMRSADLRIADALERIASALEESLPTVAISADALVRLKAGL